MHKKNETHVVVVFGIAFSHKFSPSSLPLNPSEIDSRNMRIARPPPAGALGAGSTQAVLRSMPPLRPLTKAAKVKSPPQPRSDSPLTSPRSEPPPRIEGNGSPIQHTDAKATSDAPSPMSHQAKPYQHYISKLEAEISGLERKGCHLVSGNAETEIDGLITLEKALWARTRFADSSTLGDGDDAAAAASREEDQKAVRPSGGSGVIKTDVWRRGEDFVALCNRAALRRVARLSDGDTQLCLYRTLDAFSIAFKVLCPDGPVNAFAGFGPLKQALLGATLCNKASVIQVFVGEPSAATDIGSPSSASKATDAATVTSSLPVSFRDVQIAVFQALAAERPRPSASTLYNVAAVFALQSRFEPAMALVACCIQLCDHFLTSHVHVDQEIEDLYSEFLREQAAVAVLCHHMIATVAQWTNSCGDIATQHCVLAVKCAERHLGAQHALCSRAKQRLALLTPRGDTSQAASFPSIANAPSGAAPIIALRQQPFVADGPPMSSLLPFALVVPFPPAVLDMVSRVLTMHPPRPLEFPRRTHEYFSAPYLQSSLSMPTTARGGLHVRPRPPPAATTTLPAVAAPTSSRVPKAAGAASGDPNVESQPARVPRPPAPAVSNGGEARGQAGRVPRAPLARRAGPSAGPPALTARPPHRIATTASPTKSILASTASTIDLQGVSPVSRDVHTSHSPLAGGPKTAWMTPNKISTVLPKSDFELYRQLQGEVRRYLGGSASSASPGAIKGDALVGYEVIAPLLLNDDPASTAISRRRQLAADHALPVPSMAKHAALMVGPQALKAPTSAFLIPGQAWDVMDAQLNTLSSVQPDHTDADERRWDSAARTIQHQWRAKAARLQRQARHLAVLRRLQTMQAAHRIEAFYEAFRMKLLAKAELKRRQHARRTLLAVTHVNAMLRALQTFDLHVAKQDELQAKLHALIHSRMRQQCAATCVQAVYRSFAVRQSLYGKQKGAGRIQKFFRKFRAFLQVRLLVFYRRGQRRDVLLRRNKAATTIQRFFRREIVRLTALRALRAKRQLASDYVNSFVAKDALMWQRLRLVDEDAMARRIQHFFRCVKWRRHEAKRAIVSRRQRRAASRIQRLFRWHVAAKVLTRRAAKRRHQSALQRRKEEVWEATIDVQKTVRMFLAKLERRRRQARVDRRHAAARTLQRMYRIWMAVLVRRRKRVERQWLTDRYHIAASRSYAATRIQCAVRRWIARRFAASYATFMRGKRHEYARIIQRNVRLYVARRSLERRLLSRHQGRSSVVLEERRECACRMIQRLARTFLHRRALPPKNLRLIPRSRLDQAASKIQRQWRYASARMRVCTGLLWRQTLVVIQQQQQHLWYFVVTLQRAVRRFIFMPNRVKTNRHTRQSLAAARIQRTFRKHACRRKRRRAIEARDAAPGGIDVIYLAERRSFAAEVIQKNFRSFRGKAAFQTKKAAIVTLQHWWQQRRSQLSVRRQRRDRASLCRKILLAECWMAAVVIQRAWRRHNSRTN